MKNTNIQQTLDALLNSLQPYPNMRFLLFTSKWEEAEETLSNFCALNGHEIQLYMMGDRFDIDKDTNHYIKIKPYKKGQPRYNLHGRLYDYIFIFDKIEEDDIFKRLYSSIANGGRVYILMQKDEYRLKYRLQEIMSEANYLSFSDIEIDKNSIFFSAKKMHGWGG